MSFTVKLYQVLDKLDIKGFKTLFHEYFIWIDKYQMMTFDYYIVVLINQCAERRIIFYREIELLCQINETYFVFNLGVALAASITESEIFPC